MPAQDLITKANLSSDVEIWVKRGFTIGRIAKLIKSKRGITVTPRQISYYIKQYNLTVGAVAPDDEPVSTSDATVLANEELAKVRAIGESVEEAAEAVIATAHDFGDQIQSINSRLLGLAETITDEELASLPIKEKLKILFMAQQAVTAFGHLVVAANNAGTRDVTKRLDSITAIVNATSAARHGK